MQKKLSILCSGLILCIAAFGQTEIPYSRYGLGTLLQPEPAFLQGWGNQSAAFHNAYNLNFMNPASYGYMSTTIFEAGLFGSTMNIQDNDSSANFGDGGISTLALGFPVIKNKLGVSLGLMPFSRVNYDIVQNNDSVPGLGITSNYFQGNGGLYNFYAGAGYRWKNLSIGVNASYLFGKLDYSTILAFPDTQNAFNTLRDESRYLGDILFTGGIQYHLNLDQAKKYAIDFGVTGNLKSEISASRDLMYVRFAYVDGLPAPHDTVSSVTAGNGEIVLPLRLSAGLMFSSTNHYMIGLNYEYGKWSDYTSFGEKDFTGDSWKASAGIQLIPDFKSYTQYFKLVAYRAGISMGKNYLVFDGKDLPEYEADLGLGFPLKRVLSELSFTGEWSHVGSLKDNPLTISTFRVMLGVTLNDRWFLKRKFD
jgi:hypothetical protein